MVMSVNPTRCSNFAVGLGAGVLICCAFTLDIPVALRKKSNNTVNFFIVLNNEFRVIIII